MLLHLQDQRPGLRPTDRALERGFELQEKDARLREMYYFALGAPDAHQVAARARVLGLKDVALLVEDEPELVQILEALPPQLARLLVSNL